MADTMIICRGMGSKVLKCIGNKNNTEFYDVPSIWDNGKSCFCKDCLNKIYDNYYKKTKSAKTALYFTMSQINVPFVLDVYNKALDKINGEESRITVAKYMAEFLKSKQLSYKDFYSSDFNLSEKDIKNNTDYATLELNWGVQETNSDYDFLENTFSRYTNGIDFSNPQHEDLYRDLCRDRLLLRKINDGRYQGEESLDKVQNRIAKTMSILKVDQFENKKEKSDIEKNLEYQIWEIENTEPAEVVDKNEYADFLDIQKNWGQHILRAVKNILSSSKEFPNITRDSDKY